MLLTTMALQPSTNVLDIFGLNVSKYISDVTIFSSMLEFAHYKQWLDMDAITTSR